LVRPGAFAGLEDRSLFVSRKGAKGSERCQAKAGCLCAIFENQAKAIHEIHEPEMFGVMFSVVSWIVLHEL
jgi:hypothetical protein